MTTARQKAQPNISHKEETKEMRTWKDNATEFGALSKQGVDVRLALLVAASVRKGSGQGARSDLVSNETKSGKVSASTFAGEAHTSKGRILRHLDTWDAAAAEGMCSPSEEITPADVTDLDVRTPSAEDFQEVFRKLYPPKAKREEPTPAPVTPAPEKVVADLKTKDLVAALTEKQRAEVVKVLAPTPTPSPKPSPAPAPAPGKAAPKAEVKVDPNRAEKLAKERAKFRRLKDEDEASEKSGKDALANSYATSGVQANLLEAKTALKKASKRVHGLTIREGEDRDLILEILGEVTQLATVIRADVNGEAIDWDAELSSLTGGE